MKILVPCIPFDGGKSGISVYIREVVRALRAAGHQVTCVFEGEAPAEDWVSNPVVVPKRGALFSMLYHLFVLPRRVKKLKVDCCILPAANRRAFWRYPLPTVAVVHDLSQFHVEAKYDAFRMLYVKKLLPFFVRRAASVVAISKSTADDLVRFWKIPASKISVVYDGFTPVASCGGRGGDRPASILYLSRIEHPGKNHVNLIRAYEKLPEKLAAEHPLVLAGGDWNGAEAVHAAAEASPRRALIRFTGFVKDAELAALWADAAAYVFPSRFEGFGLSLLEAMSAGIPCACSSTSSLGELGEGAAELFDPEDPDAIAAALEKILTAPDAAKVAEGRRRVALYTWERCACGLLAAFPPSRVFGVTIDCTTPKIAAEELIDAARSPASNGKVRLFAFVNAHCLNIAYSNESYREILRAATAVWPDGTGVRMAGAKLGFPVPENVNGTDLFPIVCRAAERAGVSVFFYGARQAVVEKMVENVKRDHPALKVVGWCDGYQDDATALARIREAKPDLLFVAKGVPEQERWIAAHQKELACRAAIAVGGLFDFVSGRIPRAPMWMRRHGVEWIFRLYQEPVRLFRRYVIGNPVFLMRVRREALARSAADGGLATLVAEFLRYVVVGGIAFVADFGTLWLTQELLFKSLDCGVYLATACGFFVGLAVNYALSLAFVFTQAKDRGRGRSVGAFLVFGVIGLLGLGWTELGMWLGVAVLGWDYRIVKIFVTGAVLMWNYLGRKILIFNGKESEKK